jgi:C4-dicarboxylate-specific signal transduction histidine kinase
MSARCVGTPELSYDTADRVQLQQVLVNLVTNAIDSMTSVKDRSHTLIVRSERLDEWVSISIQDSGTGIAPEEAERMFEAFYTTKPKTYWVGLACLSLHS